MPRFYQRELEEVGSFFDKNSRSEIYANFQDDIVKELRGLASSVEYIGRIHSVISRKDASQNNPLKSKKKIAIKLRKWKLEARAKRSKKKISISDIHDIVGVTITCPYPSDVRIISDVIERGLPSKVFQLKNIRWINPGESDGYSACHCVLEGRGRYIQMLCELQIKSILTHGWGIKTHDIIYKPPGEIDERLRDYMSKLSHTLQILDDQSEIIKSLIEEAWVLDKKRRHVAAKHLLMGVGKYLDPSLQNIFNFWTRNEAELSSAEIESDMVGKMDGMFVAYSVSKPALSRDFCRIVCLYALTRSLKDRNEFALEFIDQWVDGIRDRKARSQAEVFRCNAAMSLGEHVESVDGGRLVLTKAKKMDATSNGLRAEMNLAYYLAEAFYHRAFDEPTGAGKRDGSETDACGAEAISIVQRRLPEIVGSKYEAELLDSAGAVLIACGRTEALVRMGLGYCEKSRQLAKGQDNEELVEAFFALHERRAFRKLLQLGEA